MTEAEKLVETLLDGDPNQPQPEPQQDIVDPKDFTDILKSEEDAELARLKQSGDVNPRTVQQYQTIYHRTVKNADGTAGRAKVTSIKTWKTRPNDFEIGWKHGLRTYGKITPANASEWTTIEPPPVPRTKRR